MSNIAIHMRMTGLHVSNEDVDTRKAAVSELVRTWGKLKDATAIIVKATDIAQALGNDGVPRTTLGLEVESVVQSQASAFLYAENPLDVGICAGLAAIELTASPSTIDGWSAADVLATALWSALAFQPPLADAKRETLRLEVLEAARSGSMNAAEIGRKRSEVNDFAELTIAAGEEAKIAAQFRKATQSTIAALRRNAALDREELDFLWWSQLGRSRLLNRPLPRLEEPLRVIAAGIEAASHLRRLPSEVHRDIVLRTLDANPNLDLSEVLGVIGSNRAALAGSYGNGIVARAPDAFPLLHTLATGLAEGDGARVKRSCDDWGARALLEASLVQMQTTGPGKL